MASSKEEIVSYIEQFDESYTEEIRERSILKDILLISAFAVPVSAVALNSYSTFRKKRQSRKILKEQNASEPGVIRRTSSKIGSKFNRSDKLEGEN